MQPDSAMLQATFDSMQDGILVVGRDGRVAFCNRRFAALFGLPATGETGHDAIAAALDRELAEPSGSLLRMPDPGATDSVEIIQLKDGRTLERRIAPVDPPHPGAALVALYRDISYRAREGAALDEYRLLLEKAQEVAQIGSWVLPLDGSNRISWSPEMYRMHGVAPDQFDGTVQSAAAFIHEDDRAEARQVGDLALRERRPYEHEHRIVRADGIVRWVRSSVTMTCDASGTPVRFIGTLQDVTERRLLEEQLRQAQKMDAIGRLAGGIAHDLNNALTAIAGFAELALGDLPPGHRAHDDVAEVRKAAERAGSVTRQLLAFSRRELLEPRLFNLGDTVGALGRFLGRLLGDNIELVATTAPNLPPLLGDPGQVEQALVNLAVNARDAMPQGGRLTISATVEDIDVGFARAHVPMQPGRYVVLSVADTGLGMSAETRARIFEPFFTTKPVGKGTGLGLSMVYGTMKQSGGFVYVDSDPGLGSTFRLYFPPAQPANPRPAQPAASHEAVPTVLVVDDEPAVRALVSATLRGEGYRILQAASGEEAFDLATEDGTTVDLLLTDATMPGKGGLELAEELLARQPGLAVIVMSGYTHDAKSLDHLRGSVSVCQKPFTPRELRQRVRQALNR